MCPSELTTHSRVTLRDIARKANVSASTVSRSLNNHPHVDAATRSLVYQAAQELGYSLENLRKSADEITAVNLLIRTESEIYDATNSGGSNVERNIMQGVQAVLEPRGIVTYLQRVAFRHEEAAHIVEDPRVGGVIMLGGAVEHSFIEILQQSGMPVVIAGSHVLPLEVNAVMANYAYGMQIAIDHLVERGRTHIGFINGPDITNTSAEKFNGYRIALDKHGITYDPRLVTSAHWTTENGYLETLKLMRREPDIDAIIYSLDGMAVGGLRALRELGCRVPEDVGIIGCHNQTITEFTDPTLTSIHLNEARIGMIAARRLFDIVENMDPEPVLTIVPTSLVVRGST